MRKVNRKSACSKRYLPQNGLLVQVSKALESRAWRPFDLFFAFLSEMTVPALLGRNPFLLALAAIRRCCQGIHRWREELKSIWALNVGVGVGNGSAMAAGVGMAGLKGGCYLSRGNNRPLKAQGSTTITP